MMDALVLPRNLPASVSGDFFFIFYHRSNGDILTKRCDKKLVILVAPLRYSCVFDGK